VALRRRGRPGGDLLRRIGRNELDAIAACRNFVSAQHEYASAKRDGARVNQYAQQIISSAGRQDGLVWQLRTAPWAGRWPRDFARAIAAGYSDKSEPYRGYYFKVLKGQGPSGAARRDGLRRPGRDDRRLCPGRGAADYEKTGIKTFIVGYDGIVYEQDLGPETLEVFKAMERFDPDESGTRSSSPEPAAAGKAAVRQRHRRLDRRVPRSASAARRARPARPTATRFAGAGR